MPDQRVKRSMTAVVKRNADGDWYIAERGSGGYTAQLPFHTYEATAQQLVDTYFLTEGFSHTYLMFHTIYDGGAEMIAQLNDLLAGKVPCTRLGVNMEENA